jgi:hypothetical protein
VRGPVLQARPQDAAKMAIRALEAAGSGVPAGDAVAAGQLAGTIPGAPACPDALAPAATGPQATPATTTVA